MFCTMDKRKYLIVLGILLMAVFLAYGNAIFNSFVWDDDYLIVQNSFIKDTHYIKNLFSGDLLDSTTEAHRHSGYYRPLSMLSFMLDYHIWRLDPKGFHLTNILIHFLNAVLLFHILCLISKQWKLSLLAALFFTVHPIHVEAVTPVLNRMGIQSAFFILSSWLCFIQSRELKDKRLLWGSLGLFFFGLLSKEDAVVLPLILLAYDFYYFSGQDCKKLIERRKLVFYFLSFLVLGVYFAIRSINLSAQSGFVAAGQPYPALAQNFFFHALTVFQIFKDYCFKVAFSWPLLPVYWISPVKGLTNIHAWAGAGIFLAWLGLVIRFRKTHRELSFFMVFFLATLLPFLNIIPLGEAYTFHERFLYLPSAAICFMAAVGFVEAFKKYKERIFLKILVQTSLVALIFFLMIMTVIANYTWRTNLSLWRAAVEKLPGSRQAQLNLGSAYMEKGDYDKAVFHLVQSLSLPSEELISADTIYFVRLNLAKIFTERRDFDRAKKEIEDALRVAEVAGINPFAAYDKLGLMYMSAGNKPEAKKAFEITLSFNANFVTTLYNLGVLYYELDDYHKAEEALKKTMGLNPDLAYAPYALGLTYLATNRKQEAEAMFYKALSLDPDFEQVKRHFKSLRKE